VIAGEEREKLGFAMEAALKASGEVLTDALAKERAKPLRAPVVILVTAKPNDDDILTWENQLATAAAI
jgi:hypothetical protein